MNHRLRLLISKPNLYKLSRLTSSSISTFSNPTIFPIPPNHNSIPTGDSNRNHRKPNQKSFHTFPSLSSAQTQPEPEPELQPESEDDAAMNEFLSRFVHAMRPRLTESYPHCDKPTIDSMLVVIIDKLLAQMDGGGGGGGGYENASVTDYFGNEDLMKTVWDVSNTVYADMEREKKKEKMKKYLQSEEVKAMARFASEIGVRGEMLRELRFKWAREAMEEAEFYEELNSLKDEDKEEEEEEVVQEESTGEANANVEGENKDALPKRHGRINYKLYGLDMSGELWREVGGEIEEVDEIVWPKEAKEITGKCKVVTDKIVGIQIDEDDGKVSELLSEWVELLQPSRVDWLALLERIKARDDLVYLKVAELILEEPSFQADVRDYSRLIDMYAGKNLIEDVERVLKKMREKGVVRDPLILTSLLHMYSRTSRIDLAEEAFYLLKSQGYKLDSENYNAMVMAYVNAGKPESAEKLFREMHESLLTEEILLAVMQAYSQQKKFEEAKKLYKGYYMAGFQPTTKTYSLLIEACVENPVSARGYFDDMVRDGLKPDDRITSAMISSYKKTNQLDKALSLLLELEKDGFQPGVYTYSVLIDWLGKLQLIDEAEQILTKIAQLGEAPPFKIHVSLCDMYAWAGDEKKALQALGVLESKNELLDREDFERIIDALFKNGFVNDGRRMQKLMEARGLTPSEHHQISRMADEVAKLSSSRPGLR